MIGVYLGACKARHLNYNIDYNDIDNKYKPNLLCDMLDVDITKYDYIIATPPCNYWSKANYRRNYSEYSLKTKHLLPDILYKLSKQKKPFIVENVRNKTLFEKNKIFDIVNNNNIWVYYVGRHTYFTNIFFNPSCNQKKDNIQYTPNNKEQREGGENVHKVIELWLNYIHNK